MNRFHEYLESQRIAAQDYPFYALIMAAMRQADTDNVRKLQNAWPDVWNELVARYNAPGGALTPNERAYLERIDNIAKETEA